MVSDCPACCSACTADADVVTRAKLAKLLSVHDSTIQSWLDAGMPYLERGFVVANVEYRLTKAAIAPAAVTDALNAAKWFRDNARRYNVDTDRLVVTQDAVVGSTPSRAGVNGPLR